MNWDDQRVVLTGASSGIGRALALVLAERGARLALVARRAEVLAELGEAIEESGGRQPLVVPCDVGELAQVGALHAEVEAQWGGADVLINNAGRGYYRSFADADVSELEAVVQTNLLGTIYCTRAFLPGMLAQGRGRLVFISSIVGEFPVPKHAVYSATKCAINGLAESLDYELGPQGHWRPPRGAGLGAYRVCRAGWYTAPASTEKVRQVSRGSGRSHRRRRGRGQAQERS